MCALMGERERVRVPKDERGRGERESEEEEGGGESGRRSLVCFPRGILR